MSAQIVIDDLVAPPGPGSVDRDVSFLGTLFELSNFSDAGVLAWRWTLRDRPIGSSAALTAPTAALTVLAPDLPGSYLVELRTYTDVAATDLDDVDVQEVAIRFAEPFDWRVPAAGETIQQDAARGWATAREEAIRDVHTFMNSGIPQLTGASNQVVDGADPETVFGGFVLDGGLFPDNALKLRLLGVLTVAGAGTGALRLYDMGAVGAGPSSALRATCTIPNGSAGNLVVIDLPLTVVASPGVNLGEIVNARHRYELRAQVVGGAGGDKLKVHQGCIALEG